MFTDNNSLNKSLRRKIGTALTRWHMINHGDNVLVGLSGGKDSLVLLHALHEFSRRSPVKFSVSALSVRLSGMDTQTLSDYCAHLNIPYTVIEQDIIGIINTRSEKSPCSFCANMRRGILSSWASQHGFSKLALGHSLDDAVETFFMNLLHTGRAQSFQPIAHMSRTNVTVIRPLVLSTEAAIIDEAKRLSLPIVASSCPFAGHTERQRIREYVAELRARIPDLYAKVLHALEHLSEAESWSIPRSDLLRGQKITSADYHE
ncbi:MAG: tRNA 2-thiocytidine biosynthesis protein TtcA [Synergistaceae bacterium]|nr:tRNA 2-thiocytidine biosynthesis protein TtcA [Synergistaceae bacterium]